MIFLLRSQSSFGKGATLLQGIHLLGKLTNNLTLFMRSALHLVPIILNYLQIGEQRGHTIFHFMRFFFEIPVFFCKGHNSVTGASYSCEAYWLYNSSYEEGTPLSTHYSQLSPNLRTKGAHHLALVQISPR